jgi:hypothetical protein
VASLFTRMLRAAQLDAALYEEVEADHSAPVAGYQRSRAIQSCSGDRRSRKQCIWRSDNDPRYTTGMVYLGISYLLHRDTVVPGLRTEADWGQLLRTIGFSSAPGILRVIGVFLPGPTWVGLMFLVVATWMLIAMVIAVRQALDYERTTRALVVCALGWVIDLVISSVFLGLFQVFSHSSPTPSLANECHGIVVYAASGDLSNHFLV